MTQQHYEPNFLARQLGRELARLRDAARLTQEEAGRPVRFNAKKVSRIEKGQIPDFNGLRNLLDVYLVTTEENDRIVAMWERAQEKGWWHGYGLDDKGYVSLEHYSSKVLTYQLLNFPGLLQTEEYARCLFTDPKTKRLARNTDKDVGARMKRQDRLTSDEPLALHAIIDEFAFFVAIPKDVMKAQLNVLVERCRLGTVKVQVLPRSTGPHNGHGGPFTVLSFADPKEPDAVYLEHALGAVLTDNRDQVNVAKLRFRELVALSLSEAESIAFIERLAAEL